MADGYIIEIPYCEYNDEYYTCTQDGIKNINTVYLSLAKAEEAKEEIVQKLIAREREWPPHICALFYESGYEIEGMSFEEISEYYNSHSDVDKSKTFEEALRASYQIRVVKIIEDE